MHTPERDQAYVEFAGIFRLTASGRRAQVWQVVLIE